MSFWLAFLAGVLNGAIVWIRFRLEEIQLEAEERDKDSQDDQE